MATLTDLLTTKIPPQNLEAERAVLGSILLEGAGAIARLGGLTETEFYAERHRTGHRRAQGMTAPATRGATGAQ